MYSIYHIEGVKIGVSKNVKRRVKKQGYDTYEILEEHTDVYEVSLREQQLQREYGYPVDKIPYWKMINMATKQSRSKGGKIGIKHPNVVTKKSCSKGGKVSGRNNVNSGHLDRVRNLPQTKKAQSINGKLQGDINVESGHLKTIASLGGLAIVASGQMKLMRDKSAKLRKRPILQYDRDGNFIKEWDCAHNAGKALKVKGPNIVEVLKGRRKTAGGFVFKYKED
jgi:hypothetical protein